MVNLNMAPYIESALTSILNQLDERYEVLVVDGGSSDSSVKKIKWLSQFYKNLRLIELERDPERRLGEDRNISISHANGEYIMMHLDCDDIYAKKIIEWVNGFHIIEEAMGYDVYVAGKHICMAKKNLLLEYGPYKNLHFEDRELWNRLDLDKKYVGLNHIDFVIRMQLNYSEKILKTLRKTYYEIQENFVYGQYSLREYLVQEIKNLKIRKLRHKIVRIIILPVVILMNIYKMNPSKKAKEFSGIHNRSKHLSLDEILKKTNKQNIHQKFIENSIFNVK
jgi:glycosyltransferase involved in cell wall biosynthesis